MNRLKNISILFIQLGCSKNKVDGERMIDALEREGAVFTDTEDKADVIIVNTCGFIEAAKKEAIGELLSAVNTGKKVIATGCLAQRYKDEIKKDIPELSAVVGVFDTDKITDAVYNAVKGEYREYINEKHFAPSADTGRTLTTPFYYSFLKIADGCSNGCSYCAIPKIRGKYVSEPMDKLVSEAQKLAQMGITELIVIAQDTSRYGVDLYKKNMLIPLLEKLSEIDGIRWIRLHYLYPENITDELLKFIKSSDKVLPYFDIPIQHINDRILSLMNRRITKKKIAALLKKIKEEIPEAVIRTSLISGFPSETQEEHEELKDFVKKGYFDRLGVFPYSTEEGTRAAKITGKLPKRVKEKRAGEIMEIQNAVSLKKNKKRIGKTYTVLVEEIDSINGVYGGRTYMDSPEIDGEVYFTSKSGTDIGEYVNVKITGCDAYDLTGEEADV